MGADVGAVVQLKAETDMSGVAVFAKRYLSAVVLPAVVLLELATGNEVR